jgi:hypothetical protein
MTYGEFWVVRINQDRVQDGQRSFYEQWRQSYFEANPQPPIENVRREFRKDWRSSILSVQNIGDEWRDLIKDSSQPYVTLWNRVDSLIFKARFDFAAWRSGMMWVGEKEWHTSTAQGSNG